MDSLRYRRKAVPASIKIDNMEQFLPDMTIEKQRPLSNATDFDDTDFEYSDEEEESPRMSRGSFGYDSNSSLSTPDIPTPDKASRRPFNWDVDKMVEGPSGPHLFRDSMISERSVPTEEIDLYFERSPVQDQFPPSFTETTNTPEPTNTRFQFSPRTPKAYTTLQPDVSQVHESEIRNWTPSQVAHWVHIAGYDNFVIETFIANDIAGEVLLSLEIDDLKELGIKSFGKRHQLMTSINYLRNTMKKGSTPEAYAASLSRSSSRDSSRHSRENSYEVSVSPTGEVIATKAALLPSGTQISPGESVSIVGIEQVLPKPHSCSKGENCSKFKKRQRQLEILAAEFPGAVLLPGGSILTGNPGNPETARNMLRPTSEAQPSVVASSDILGPAQASPRLSAEALNGVRHLDPQESVRHYLSYQHVDPPARSESVPLRKPAEHMTALGPPPHTPHVVANLRTLPKLMIPTDSDSEDELLTTVTPSMASYVQESPTVVQQYGPFSSMQYKSPGDYYRQGTPFSEVDVPVTAIPDGPIARDTSQSVPPDMRYGIMNQRRQEPFMRSSSLRQRPIEPLRRVREDKPLTPIEDPSDLYKSPRIPTHTSSSSTSSLTSNPDVTRAGYMKKRKQTRFLRHEWQDAHFTLRGTELAMHKDELEAHRKSRALEVIDVDDYAVACSSLATSSKLSAAFKRSVLRSGQNPSQNDATFAFALIPANKENEKKMLFGSSNVKSHHFAVKTRDERIDWMRELMLAKALKQGRENGVEMQLNGNFI